LLLVRVEGQHHFIESIRLSEKATLRRVDGHVVSRNGHLGGRDDEGSDS
jgi:hypothetical protein